MEKSDTQDDLLRVDAIDMLYQQEIARMADPAHLGELYRAFGRNNFELEATKKEEITAVLSAMRPRAGEAIVDLGSGLGHFILAAAARYPRSHFTGVEIVPSRCAFAAGMARSSGINNAVFIAGDARGFELSGFDHVFLNNPFFVEDTDVFCRKLTRMRPPGPRFYVINNAVTNFRHATGLREVAQESGIADYRFGVFELEPNESPPDGRRGR